MLDRAGLVGSGRLGAGGRGACVGDGCDQLLHPHTGPDPRGRHRTRARTEGNPKPGFAANFTAGVVRLACSAAACRGHVSGPHGPAGAEGVAGRPVGGLDAVRRPGYIPPSLAGSRHDVSWSRIVARRAIQCRI